MAPRIFTIPFLMLLLLSLAAGQPKLALDPAYTAFANQLFLASGETGRAELLAAHNELSKPELIHTMNELAGAEFDRRDYAKALSLYQTAFAVATTLGDTGGKARTAYNLGLTEARLFHAEPAISWYNQSITFYQQLGQKGELVAPLNGLGSLLQNTGRTREAIPYYLRALTDAADAGSEVYLAQTNTNLGNVYYRLGNFVQAIQCLEKALEVTRRRGMERQSAMIMNNLGSVYYDQNDLQLALSYLEQSLVLKQKRNDPEEMASSILNIGVVSESLGDHTKAAGYFDRALQLTQAPALASLRVRTLCNLGNLQFHTRQYADARHSLEESLQLAEKIQDRVAASAARTVLGRIASRERQYPVAEQLARGVIADSRLAGETRMLVDALDLLGVSLQDQERPVEAEAALQEALQLAEQLHDQLPGERLGVAQFMDDQAGVYLHMVRLQLDQHRPEAALAYVERSKARALLDVLQTGASGITKSMTAEEVEQEAALTQKLTLLNEEILRESRRSAPDHKKITALASQLEKARTEYRSFQVVLYSAHPELKLQRVALEPVRPRDLLATVPDAKTALLEFSVAEDEVRLFVLTAGAENPAGNALQVYRLSAKPEALRRDVQRFREQVATRDLAYRQLAVSLYRDLLQPAAAQLHGKTALVISPDSFLWQLPFQALETEPSRFLLQDCSVFYTPSLSVLHEIQRLHPERPLAPRLLALDATGAESSTNRPAAFGLPDLARVYGPGHSQLYYGGDADEAHIRREAPEYQVLHLSAHGVFDDRSPMHSYLLLAKEGKPEAGVLEARQMMEWNLRADLVVLSGCETGRGTSAGAEGLIGMSWALFIAGSPSTVASQWKVEAAATNRLLLGFHRNLQHSGKARALQLAALDLMKTPAYRHPFYWSSFVLMGQGF